VGALTVNKVCGSGLKSVVLATQAIRLGDHESIVAGGMESMSQAPYLVPKARDGLRLGHGQIIDSMVGDGLWCAFEDFHMGLTGELVAERYEIKREEQDEFAVNSHKKAVAAMNAGRFDDELTPVEVALRKKTTTVERDEGPRDDTTLEGLAKLKPAFKRDGGTVTPGNASTINDGAAAVVVASEDVVSRSGTEPLARIVAYATSGIEPKWVMMAPVEATTRVLSKAGWDRDDVDLYEFNEAFSAQSLAVLRELKIDPERVNVNGGAVALGHPIGCSGARILVTLLFEMRRRDAKRGIAALCMGGGNGVAVAVERS
jgi:acetyl-CoA C-acetyltransferase